MSGLFGSGGAKGTTPAFNLTGGGTNAPWNWGVSPFDQSLIDQGTTSNQTAVTNRYNQLGLGGSTMEGQDIAGASQMGEAMTGQLQTQNVGNQALNPALQPPINQIIGNVGSSGSNSALTSLASSALGGSGISGSAATDAGTTSALSSLGPDVGLGLALGG